MEKSTLKVSLYSEPHHAIFLKVSVVVIPKEEWVRMTVSIILWVWHWLIRINKRRKCWKGTKNNKIWQTCKNKGLIRKKVNKSWVEEVVLSFFEESFDRDIIIRIQCHACTSSIYKCSQIINRYKASNIQPSCYFYKMAGIPGKVKCFYKRLKRSWLKSMHFNEIRRICIEPVMD